MMHGTVVAVTSYTCSVHVTHVYSLFQGKIYVGKIYLHSVAYPHRRYECFYPDEENNKILHSN